MGRDDAERGDSAKKLGGNLAPNSRLSINLISYGLPIHSGSFTRAQLRFYLNAGDVRALRFVRASIERGAAAADTVSYIGGVGRRVLPGAVDLHKGFVR